MGIYEFFTDVLIVTATRVESKAVFEVIGSLSGHYPKPVTVCDRIYHDLGHINNARVFLAQCEMGAGGLGASMQTIQKGIDALSPAFIIMTGIAFGIDSKKQSIGDILVSKQLSLYELQRVSSENNGIKLIPRGDRPHVSPLLLNLFRSADLYWDESKPKVRFGLILSGEKLVDNIDFREQLLKFEPEAIGGEMEGAGLYVACQDAKVDWILVKSICDWADGGKSQSKAEQQDKAAHNAASFVLHALQIAPLKRGKEQRMPDSRSLLNSKSTADKVTDQINKDTRGVTNKQAYPPEKGNLPDIGNLPNGSRLPFYHNAVFTGRNDDLLWLADALLYSNGGYVCGLPQIAAVVTGFGGEGKTQLAIEFCYRYGRFFQGVHWIHADQDIPSEIAACGLAMNLPRWPDKIPDQLSFTLKALQGGGGPRLVVLDNVENSLVLQDWMPKLSYCKLLLTSRQPEWPPDLGLRIRPLGVLPRLQSIELLCRLSPRLRKVSDEELDEIANRLGDLPLALDLAARYLADRPSLSPKDYLTALKEAGNALEHTSLKSWVKHSPTKHATSLAATFSMSWNQLGDDEIDQLPRHVFKACGYCAPNTSIPLNFLTEAMNADEMLDQALNRLSSLGLITLTDNGPRLHPLLAEFARLQDANRDGLINLSETLASLAELATKIGLPEHMRPLRRHLRTAAKFAEVAGLQKAGLLWNELGCHLRADAEYNDAKKCSARALMIDKKFCGSHHPIVAKRFNNLGVDLKYLGNSLSAKKCHQRAIKIEEENNGSNSPQLAKYLNNLGADLEDLTDIAESKKCYSRALDIAEASYGSQNPNIAIFSSNLGRILGIQGDLLGAKKCFVRALKIDIKAYGRNHPQVAKRLNNLGAVLFQLHYPLGAKRCILKALDIDRRFYGLEHCEVGIKLLNLADLQKSLGDEKAQETFDMAAEILNKKFGNESAMIRIRNRKLFGVL